MNISNETHVLKDYLTGPGYTFELLKLPHSQFDCSYLVFWNNGHCSSWYNSVSGVFKYIDGKINSCVFFHEKPKDQPWTTEDAIPHLEKMVYNMRDNAEFQMQSVGKHGVYSIHGIFYSFQTMLDKKFHVGIAASVPTYKKV
jgi:hypothetical protein